MADVGVEAVTLTGGEPLIRNDFTTLYTHLRRLGIRVIIESNLSLLTQKHISLFDKYPPERIDVSVYGFEQIQFENLVQRKIKVSKPLQNVKKLNSHGINLRIRAPLTIYNLKSLHLLKHFAEENSINFDYDHKVWWSQDGRRNVHLRITTKHVEPLIDMDPIYNDLLKVLKKNGRVPKPANNCNIGLDAFYMNPF